MGTISCGDREDEVMDLPPGFRFHPTDEELITHYLSKKILDCNFSARAIGEVDLNKVEPWDLPWRAKMGEKEWYFFCVRDRKYPTGLRTNRATEAGYWKATGKDKEIIHKGKQIVGMKKTLVFYKGRAPRGEKTNWVMHEYRLEGNYYNLPKPTKNDWVISRVFHKTSCGKKIDISGLARITGYGCGRDEFRPPNLPPLADFSALNGQARSVEADASHVTCFSNELEDQKPHEEAAIDSFNNTSLLPSSSSDSFFFNQYAPNSEKFTYPDPFLMRDESLLRILLHSNVPNRTQQNSKSEVSQDTGMSTEFSSVMSNQDDPITSSGPLDLDSLWNY